MHVSGIVQSPVPLSQFHRTDRHRTDTGQTDTEMASDDTMELPTGLLRKHCTCALERGSRLLKIVYESKESSGVERKDCETANLKFASFATADLDKAIDFIRQNCLIIKEKDEQQAVVYTTGVISDDETKKLESSLSARVVHMPKMQCFAKGVTTLFKAGQLTKYLEQGTVDPRKEIEMQNKKVDGFTAQTKHKFEYHYDEINDLAKMSPEETYALSSLFGKSGSSAFPCLLVKCGSRVDLIQVNEDGSCERLDNTCRGGGSFMGIGSLLSGAKTFEELIKLVEEGDSTQVHVQLFDIIKKMTENDDVYNGMVKNLEDEITFCLGKAPGKTVDDFKSQDMVKALLEVVAIDISLSAVNVAMATGMNDVIYCGSFLNTKTVRDTLAKFFMKKKVHLFGLLGEGKMLNLHFLRHGAHFGALGAMLSETVE